METFHYSLFHHFNLNTPCALPNNSIEDHGAALTLACQKQMQVKPLSLITKRTNLQDTHSKKSHASFIHLIIWHMK